MPRSPDPTDPPTPTARGSSTTARAVVRSAYGGPDVLRVVGTTPTDPTTAPLPAGDVRVRVHAAAICKGDIHLLTGTPYLVRAMGVGIRRPKTPACGQEFAGVVIAIGSEVTSVAVGDAVFGQTPFGRFGAWASEVVTPATSVTAKPDALSFVEAAAMNDSATTALQAVRDHAAVGEGDRVLGNGASGGVGSFAVPIARALGAHVTAVVRTRNVEAMHALGADAVIDATQVDFTRVAPAAGEAPFDAVIDVVGNHSIGALAGTLTESGRLVAVSGGTMGNWVGPIGWMLRLKLADLRSKRKIATFIAEPSDADRRQLAAFAEAGTVRPLIDQVYPLEDVVEAVRHVAEGHTRGKTVLALVEGAGDGA